MARCELLRGLGQQPAGPSPLSSTSPLWQKGQAGEAAKPAECWCFWNVPAPVTIERTTPLL